jgi:hypothetical protein
MRGGFDIGLKLAGKCSMAFGHMEAGFYEKRNDILSML